MDIYSSRLIHSYRDRDTAKKPKGGLGVAMEKPYRVFIGSASEGLEVAKAVRSQLDRDQAFDTHLWDKGTFEPSLSFIESLEKELDVSDFAVLTLTPDDKSTSRKKTTMAPRDNVLFELGLFMGRLKRERTFFVRDRGQDLKIPSDLLGVSPVEFEVTEGCSLEEALAIACVPLIARMKELRGREKLELDEQIEIRRSEQFVERIAGAWWERVSSANDVKVSFFRILPDHVTHAVRMEGDAFEETGKRVSHWKSVAVGLRVLERTAVYFWEGNHAGQPTGDTFKGFGELTFQDTPGKYERGEGLFSDTQMGKKVTIWKSVEVRRVAEEELVAVERILLEPDEVERNSKMRAIIKKFGPRRATLRKANAGI